MDALTLADLETLIVTHGEGWALAHVHRILRLVEDIGADLTYDAHALTVAAYLHDWGAFPRYGQPTAEHALRSRQVAEAEILPRMDLTPAQVALILDAIELHDYRDPRPVASTEALLLREADFLVLMLPYSPAAHHIIGAAELAAMKPTAHLINVARGGVVDDGALIEALQRLRSAGAGLDVFENEPALDARFATLDNVVLTPHIGSSSRATRLAMAMCAADNLIAALAGQRPPNLLNPEVFGG